MTVAAQTATSVVAGVDGCPGGWIVATSDQGGSLTLRVVGAFAEVLLAAPRPDVVAVDIPIGLPDLGARACDVEARRLLGARRSSVFPAPIRPALSARSYDEACEKRFRIERKRYSLQTWYILAKIRQVDNLLAADPRLQDTVREAHPELCFRALAGGTPMAYGKKTRAGQIERRELLSKHFGPGLCVLDLSGASSDDVLDALAALWTAERLASGKAERIPDRTEVDRVGLRMEMWF
jgi:predicted RNase H-like nuclease